MLEEEVADTDVVVIADAAPTEVRVRANPNPNSREMMTTATILLRHPRRHQQYQPSSVKQLHHQEELHHQEY